MSPVDFRAFRPKLRRYGRVGGRGALRHAGKVSALVAAVGVSRAEFRLRLLQSARTKVFELPAKFGGAEGIFEPARKPRNSK